MIVNSAYMYMGKSAPANPVIFEKKDVNYPYSGKNYTRSDHNGYFSLDGVSELIFSDLDLTNFTKLSVSGHPGRRSLGMSVVFIDDSGNISQSVYKSYAPEARTTQVWDIPQQFRTKKCKVKFTTNNSYPLLLYSAILS